MMMRYTVLLVLAFFGHGMGQCPYTAGVIDYTGVNLGQVTSATFADCFVYFGNTTTLLLSHCSITDISTDAFNNFYDLTTLKLDNNDITSVANSTFQSLVTLESLDLSHNYLTQLYAGLLDILKLVEVDFSYNNISYVQPGIVSDINEDLISFKMSHNALQYLDPWPWQSKTTTLKSLDRVFDFTYNNISAFTNYMNWTFDLVYPFQINIDLQFNVLQSLTADTIRQYIPDIEDDAVFAAFLTLVINATNNPYFCDCNLFRFANIIRGGVFRWSRVEEFRYRCGSPSAVAGIDWIHDLDMDLLVCNLTVDDGCPTGCSCEDRPHNDTLFIDCRNAGLKAMPETIPTTERSKIEMFLDNNDIESLSNVSYIESIYNLSLSNNKIDSIDPEILKALTTNEHLNLANNLISALPKEIQKFSYSTVILSGNPLTCDCDSIWMSDWMKLDQSDSDTSLTCESESGTHSILTLNLEELNCTNRTMIILLVFVGVLFAILVGFLIFAKMCPHETLVIIYKISGFHPRDKYIVDELPVEEKPVDLYLCFDPDDSDVPGYISCFLKKLNNKKRKYPNSVINPSRFTEAGSQAESIEKWVGQSKRILVFLSDKIFIREWPMYAIQNAEANINQAEANQNRTSDREQTDGGNPENEQVEMGQIEGEEEQAGPAAQIIYIIHNPKSEKLRETLKEEPWKSRLAGKVVLSVGERMFWSKLRYELPRKGNGRGDGNLTLKDGVLVHGHDQAGIPVVPRNSDHGRPRSQNQIDARVHPLVQNQQQTNRDPANQIQSTPNAHIYDRNQANNHAARNKQFIDQRQAVINVINEIRDDYPRVRTVTPSSVKLKTRNLRAGIHKQTKSKVVTAPLQASLTRTITPIDIDLSGLNELTLTGVQSNSEVNNSNPDIFSVINGLTKGTSKS